MFKRNLVTASVIVVAFILGGVLQPLQYIRGYAQPACRTFIETGKQVCGQFLNYWTTHGGLAQQGYPLSGEFTEVSDLNGKPYTVQYFERAVFERHPENAAPFDVLLSQLGTFQFKKKYPNGDPSTGGVAPTQVPVVEQPLHYSGSQSLKTPPFNLTGGTYEFTWALDLQGESQAFFAVWLYGTNNTFSDLLVNEIARQGGPQSGSTFVYNVPRGSFYFDISITRGAYDFTLTKK